VFFMSIKFFILYNIDHRHNIDSKRMKHVGNIK
jgi:hypothetical protein